MYFDLTHQGFSGSGDDDEDDLPDAFDFPEAEPTEVFVNPFACSINPLDWREVQVQQHSCTFNPSHNFSSSHSAA